MSRPKGIIKRMTKNISLPRDIVVRMELELYSEVEGRIPIGAQSALIEGLLREHYAKQDEAAAAKAHLLSSALC